MVNRCCFETMFFVIQAKWKLTHGHMGCSVICCHRFCYSKWVFGSGKTAAFVPYVALGIPQSIATSILRGAVGLLMGITMVF
jgi:hypothetical protein